MKILEKLNLIYGKFLYILTPITTLVIAALEIFGGNNDGLHVLAYIVMGFVSISFMGFYMMSKKRNIVFCLIELFMLYYVTFLSIAHHVEISDSIWCIFIFTAMFGLVFILTFQKFYNKKCRK